METAYRRSRWHPPSLVEEEEGWVPSFRRRSFIPGFVRLVLLTASLIKSLRPEIVYFFSPTLCCVFALFYVSLLSFVGYAYRRPRLFRCKEITVLRLANGELDPLV